MASLRDVFQHAGKPIQIHAGDSLRAEGKAIRRGDVILVEARLAPMMGERIVFAETREWFRVLRSEPQLQGEKIDHYRVTGESIRG